MKAHNKLKRQDCPISHKMTTAIRQAVSQVQGSKILFREDLIIQIGAEPPPDVAVSFLK